MFSFGLNAELHVCTSWSHDETFGPVDLKMYFEVPLFFGRRLGFTGFGVNLVPVSIDV